MAVSFALGWVVNWASGIGYWPSWGIIVFAWVAVGISTFFDDDETKALDAKTLKDSANAKTDT